MLLVVNQEMTDTLNEMIRNPLTKCFAGVSLSVLLASWFWGTGVSAQNIATDFMPSGISGSARLLSVTLNPEVPEKALAGFNALGALAVMMTCLRTLLLTSLYCVR